MRRQRPPGPSCTGRTATMRVAPGAVRPLRPVRAAARTRARAARCRCAGRARRGWGRARDATWRRRRRGRSGPGVRTASSSRAPTCLQRSPTGQLQRPVSGSGPCSPIRIRTRTRVRQPRGAAHVAGEDRAVVAPPGVGDAALPLVGIRSPVRRSTEEVPHARFRVDVAPPRPAVPRAGKRPTSLGRLLGTGCGVSLRRRRAGAASRSPARPTASAGRPPSARSARRPPAGTGGG